MTAFWNLTNGVRPAEPVLGLFAGVCESEGHHVYDAVYGPRECARCGHQDRLDRCRLQDREFGVPTPPPGPALLLTVWWDRPGCHPGSDRLAQMREALWRI